MRGRFVMKRPKIEEPAVKINLYGKHNHVPDKLNVSTRTAISELKARAKVTMETPANVVATVMQTTSPVVQGNLPNINLLKKCVQRTRNVTQGIPANPSSLFELNIPQQYKETTAGQNFLAFDSGPGDERILIFATQRGLQCLARSDVWFCDGTFDTAPNLFEQLYSVHCIVENMVIVCAFILLPGKSQHLYDRAFQALHNLRPDMQPKKVLIDFERGAKNALQREFPGIVVKGCNFHFAQCVWRQIQSIPDILRRFKADEDFAVQLKMLISLSFVPSNDVVEKFEEMLQFDFFKDNEELLAPLMNYFESTWIGLQTLIEIQQEQIVAGNQPIQGRKAYRDTAKRIKHIVQEIDKRLQVAQKVPLRQENPGHR
ncbi:hypothetical protein B566_EDAN014789 [Ephemera danica]|nr:hypothetical protein B566_EDAN014789 [Ephemera danica]